MANYPAKIQRLIDEGYTFNFSDYISTGFNLMSRNTGGYIGYFLLVVLIYVVGSLIPCVGGLAVAVVAPSLVIGFAHVAHLQEMGQPLNFNDFFRGFDRLADLFITALLIGLLTVAAIVPGYIMLFVGLFSSFGDEFVGSNPEELFGEFPGLILGNGLALAGLLLVIIPATYMSIAFSWSAYFVWFFNMGPWDAMQASRRVIQREFWRILLFVIVTALIGLSGLILLGVGMLFTYPAMLLMHYAAFSDVLRLEDSDTDSDADVIEHFAPTDAE
jgi:hypothetical protein